MSACYHRAVGYGMPWHRFEELYLGECESHLTLAHLQSVFAAATEEMLTVDDEFYRKCFYTSGIPSIWEKLLLSRNFTDGGRKHADIGDPADLMTIIRGRDDPRIVLFFPNLRYAKMWQRRNDALDLAFDRWKDGTRRSDPYETMETIKVLPYGHDPFTTYLMRADGTPEEWRFHKDLEGRDDLLPAVPSEYRFYLPRLGILDDCGVNELRPYLAQWWS